MIKSLSMSTVLLFIFLLMCVGAVSARTGGAFVPNPGSTAQINSVASASNPSPALPIWASTIYTGSDGGKRYGSGNGDGNNNGGDDGNNNEGDDENHEGGDKPKNHDPTPEPSTILSFGAALLIGGGVLYSRRLRRNRK
jgi:hypothetical protein